MSRGRKPTPSEEDMALWEHVTRSTAPLRQARKPAARAGPAEPAKTKEAGAAMRSPVPRQATAPSRAPALSPLDRRTMSRINRGALAIDGRIDLHGMTQAAAHRRLIVFLRDAQESGARLVLVITGKGRSGGAGDERGVLRRMVPVWLASADLRPLVVGFDEAGRAHGGAGALYVRLRRSRRDG